ncbi:MAG: hypothetical protein AB7O04_15625 [Hyphomonadaceae bacterium]
MQEAFWLFEIGRAWNEGGWEAVRALPSFWIVVLGAAALVPPTIIFIGVGDDWRETPLAAWFGLQPNEDEENWAIRARDIDKDGMPDI